MKFLSDTLNYHIILLLLTTLFPMIKKDFSLLSASLLFSALICFSHFGFSQNDSLPELPEGYEEAIDHREAALGSFSYQISSDNEKG